MAKTFKKLLPKPAPVPVRDDGAPRHPAAPARGHGLLGQPTFRYDDGIGGASAGAVNAAAPARGFAAASPEDSETPDPREAAHACLRRIWQGITSTGAWDP